MLLCLGIQSKAQQIVLPLAGTQQGGIAMVVDSVSLTRRQQDATVCLRLKCSLLGAVLPRDRHVRLLPQLVGPNDTVTFPAVEVYGRWAYYATVRGAQGRQATQPVVQLRDRDMRTFVPYLQTVAFEPWMSQASLLLTATLADGCDRLLGKELKTVIEPDVTVTRRQDEGRRDVQTDHLQGTAYIAFANNRTEILPELMRNRQELARLRNTIDSVRRHPNCELRHIAIKGYASPDGPYDNNARLAKGRTESLSSYITQWCGIDPMLMSTDYVAEDWDGLRRYVADSAWPERYGMLAVIDSKDDPDAKLSRLALAYPERYRYLKENVFPRLRHTDYQIDYILRTVTEQAGDTHTDTLRQLVMADDNSVQQPVARPIHVYRPWAALKTNLLFDLAVAPNIEVEIPIGRHARWSFMAEYWNPWWRWDRLDQSYEVQVAGVELRHWLLPHCNGSRPVLSGHFLGAYCASGKYDLENDQVGDQGEVTSVGMTYGFCWPLSRHWNIEMSASAGALWGQRRHYNAEFESTHLIYKYTKNMFYVGPTKLKVSIVYLLGKGKRK